MSGPLAVSRMLVAVFAADVESYSRLMAGGPKGQLENFFRYQPRESEMSDAEIGWIAAIIIGGLAGWLAEMFMKSGTGILMNIVLGIVGAALANWLLGLFGVALGGWIGYLIAGFIGACIIIFLWRAIRARTA
jgi:uncharacterized membrane protein YeaQ/YmgE (transglycosylase-associated protein family)